MAILFIYFNVIRHKDVTRRLTRSYGLCRRNAPNVSQNVCLTLKRVTLIVMLLFNAIVWPLLLESSLSPSFILSFPLSPFLSFCYASLISFQSATPFLFLFFSVWSTQDARTSPYRKWLFPSSTKPFRVLNSTTAWKRIRIRDECLI